MFRRALRLGYLAAPRFVRPLHRRVALAAAGGLSVSASAAAFASCHGRSIFTAEQQEDVAITLIEKINIGPIMLMPTRLKEAIIVKIVAAVAEAISSSDLDEKAREEIRLAAESYSDGVSPETVNRVSTAPSTRGLAQPLAL